MKTLLITIAAGATLLGNAAFAASTSNSEGEVRVFNADNAVIAENAGLDFEPTASVVASADQVFIGTQRINGRDAEIRYTIEGGERNIISKVFRSSDR